MRTIWWDKDRVFFINQRELPAKLEYIVCREPSRIVTAIKDLEIRGAPAIGIAAAMSLALTAYNSKAMKREQLQSELEDCAETIKKTRPTAWNLFWAVDKVLKRTRSTKGRVDNMREAVIKEALAIADEDLKTNKTLGTYGASLLEDGDIVGTICNAGWLATAGEYGTALGVIKVAHEQGKKISVIALETRPILQGARLTAFELKQDGIDVKVISDGAIGYCFSKSLINKFICGADRVVWSSGCHIFNKIGTYTASVAASRHHIPFYVAAPFSTFDFEHSVEAVTIEERDPKEVKEIFGHQIVPEDVPVLNPSFDVTPPELISAIITERGIIYPPFKDNVKSCQGAKH
ncbi:MAG: S-methyl-5-thioribose-1-phosphate isomerase [Candidatus Bathyarchaeota archaeon]